MNDWIISPTGLSRDEGKIDLGGVMLDDEKLREIKDDYRQQRVP